MFISIYRLFSNLIGPFVRGYLLYRLIKGKEDTKRYRERLGLTQKNRPTGKLLWFHAASIGESLSLLSLIDHLNKEYPEFRLLVTTGTVSSAKLLEKRLPKYAFHQYVPIDRAIYVKRFLKYWRPSLAIWSESEFWPNLIIETARENIPLLLIQGRLSEKAYKKWKMFPWAIKNILTRFKICLAQTKNDAERLNRLGAPVARYLGNLKVASLPLPYNGKDLEVLKNKILNRRVWLAASTHNYEEEIIWSTHLKVAEKIPDLLTIIVPRHPVRSQAIAAKLSVQGANVVIRSSHGNIKSETQIYLADTMGELGLFYRLVDIVFVGKSLVNLGGQNLMEPALLNNTILHGPYVWNFSEIVRELHEQKSVIQVMNAEELAKNLYKLFLDSDLQQRYATLALNFAKKESNVVDVIFKELEPYFEEVKAKT